MTTKKKEEKKMVDQIEETDRVKLHEAWLELVALNNAVSALHSEVAKLQSDIASHQKTIAQYTDEGAAKDVENKGMLEEVKTRYGIPDDYNIDSKTGKVYEPGEPMPPSKTPLVSRRQ